MIMPDGLAASTDDFLFCLDSTAAKLWDKSFEYFMKMFLLWIPPLIHLVHLPLRPTVKI